ncbi:hypothetical protein ALC56_00203 [Trachymyrmex septentrionalis]|uniref:Uncharacterized protein n=1 Tax=Trachymyrmex septentrionalis TaxID=34720 RepID=A0A195FYH6_9HYME|nr:hypothetical protein ALC56_00203 [Trachymyrmex septentrionalis]
MAQFFLHFETELNDGTATNLDGGGSSGLTTCRIKRHTGEASFPALPRQKNILTVTPNRALFALITCASHKAGQSRLSWSPCIRCALAGMEKRRGKKNEGEGEAEGEADRGVNGKERLRWTKKDDEKIVNPFSRNPGLTLRQGQAKLKTKFFFFILTRNSNDGTDNESRRWRDNGGLTTLITCASHKAGQTVSCIRCALVGTEKCRGRKNKDEEGEAEGEADRGVNGKERPRALTAKRQNPESRALGRASATFDRALYRPSRQITIFTRALRAMVVGIAKLGMWNETCEWTDEVT